MKKTLFILALIGAALSHSCQKDPQEKLCDGIICNNGGTCVNGECECPPKYTGPSCSQEVPPVKMRVGTIALTSFPPTDQQGAGWDLFDGPDVFLSISKSGVVLYETNWIEDLTGAWSWIVNFEFTDPLDTYTISVFDYDDGFTADDFMGGIDFTPYLTGKKFPTAYNVGCPTCTVSFQFSSISYFH